MKYLTLLWGPSGVNKSWIQRLVDRIPKIYETVPESQKNRICSKPDYGFKFKIVRVHKTAGHDPDEAYVKSEDVESIDPRFRINCRGVPQFINPKEIEDALATNDSVLIEVYHTAIPMLKKEYGSSSNIKVNAVFLSPLTKNELEDIYLQGATLSDYIKGYMREVLEVRSYYYEGKNTDDNKVAEIIEKRASDACVEMFKSYNSEYVIENKFNESSRWIWQREALVGDALKSVIALYEITRYGGSRYAEPGKNYRRILKRLLIREIGQEGTNITRDNKLDQENKQELLRLLD